MECGDLEVPETELGTVLELETAETWLCLRTRTDPETVLELESVGMLEPLPGIELETMLEAET